MRKVSLEARKKISETMKRKWKEKEYRENQIKSTTGRKLTDEHKNNISKARQGIELEDKTKHKMSEYQSNRPKEVKDKQVKSWKKQWDSLTREEQLDRLEPWIEAGRNARWR